MAPMRLAPQVYLKHRCPSSVFHPPPDSNTDALGGCCPWGLMGVRMPSQGQATPYLQGSEVKPKEVRLGQDSGFACPQYPHPKSAPPHTHTPLLSLSPLCKARSLFVTLHKSAAIKMHWSRTALG